MRKQKRQEKIFEKINKMNKLSSRQEKENLNDSKSGKVEYYYQSYRNKKN